MSYMTCTAERHGNEYAARVYGCTCPEAVAARRALRPKPVRGHSPAGRPEPWITAERKAKALRLTRAGLSASEIAIQLRIAERTVTRYRAELREQTGHQLVASR